MIRKKCWCNLCFVAPTWFLSECQIHLIHLRMSFRELYSHCIFMWRSENMNVGIKRSFYVYSTNSEFYLRLFDGIFVPKVWKNIDETLAGEARALTKCNQLRTMKPLLCFKGRRENIAVNKYSIDCTTIPNFKWSMIKETLQKWMTLPENVIFHN